MFALLKAVAVAATGVLFCAVAQASPADPVALGADHQGALHFGEIRWTGGVPKMHQDAVIEFYNKTDHWRIQRQRSNRGWESRPAKVQTGENATTSRGMVGKAKYVLQSERVSPSAFRIRWEVDSRQAAEYYRRLNEIGAVLVFNDDEGTGLLADGKPVDYATAPERSHHQRKMPKEIAVVLPSGERFTLSGFEGFAFWDVIRTRGQVLLTLGAGTVKGKGIGYGLTLATANEASTIGTVAANAFEFHHPHDGWFLMDAPESGAFVDSPSFNFVDVSASLLEAPAGKHGFLQVRDGRFYFEDGTGPVRLSGVTLVHGSKFPSRAEAGVLAGRIAAMGCNLVRFHHIDYFKPGFGFFDRGHFETSTAGFDAELMDRMDYLIHQLKLRGVYVHMDALTARKFGPGDGVPAHDKLTFGLKGTAYLHENTILMEKQKQFLTALWTHHNPHTGLEYRNDPVFATTEIVNENDLFTHGSLDHHFPEPYRTEMRKMFADWCERNGHGGQWTYASAPKEIAGLFCMDLMRDYYRKMHSHLRGIGVRIPISGTNWNPGSLGVFAAQREMDYTADHPYGTDDYYRREPGGEQSRAGLLSLSKMKGKPLVHNEWNVVNVTGITRAATFLYQMALMGAAGHDGSYLFALFHHSTDFNAGDINTLNIGSDPAMRALYPAAALLLVRGDMAVSDVAVRYTPDLRTLLETNVGNFDHFLSGFSRASFQRRTEIDYSDIPLSASKVPFKEGFPAAAAPSSRVVSGGSEEMSGLLAPPGDDPARNFSGELVSHWKERWFMVKTPRSKWVAGYPPGGEPIDLGDGVTVALEQEQFACVTITALDDKPVAQSGHLMVVTVSDVEQPGLSFDRRWREPGHLENRSDLVCRPIRAVLKLPTPSGKLLVRHKGPRGEVVRQEEVFSADGSVHIRLNGAVLAYEIVIP